MKTRFARKPSDRAYTCIGWSIMVLIGLILGFGFLVAPRVSVPRAIGFRLVITLILLFNLLWLAIADRRFARFIVSDRRSTVLRVMAILFSVSLSAPIATMLFIGRGPDWLNTVPTWYAAAVTLWHLGLVTLMPGIALLRLCVLGIMRLWRRLRSVSKPRPQGDVDDQRRLLLRTAVASVPMILVGAGASASRMQERRLHVSKHELAAPWLPDRLKGLTLTHISDLHVGRHYRPYMLDQLVEKVNDLNSDLIVATGDIVDMSNDLLPPAIRALQQMESRHGLYACIGNHDEIDDRHTFVTQFRKHFPLLINERHVLRIGGERLTLAGLDYASQDYPSRRRAGFERDSNAMLEGYDERQDGPIIVLSHHPHAFDRLSERGVRLTLSGHTHGGQIMSRASGKPRFGLGDILFRYVHGFYERDGNSLFVTAGIGNWFPLRVHAPAEVVQLRLI